MTRTTPGPYTDAQRMELRSFVQLAGEVIAQFWPMRTFIHHNPLHGLEGLPFAQAVKQGAQLFGGRGYLSNETWRERFHAGRIHLADLRAAVEPLTVDKLIEFAGRRISHLDVLTLSMTQGLMEQPTVESERSADHMAAWLTRVLPSAAPSHARQGAQADTFNLPTRETLSTWCDDTLGTNLVETLDRELVKWASAFLDEGEVGWSMPYRDRTFYRAWKSLAQYDATFRLIGIDSATEKIRALPDRPEDALLDHLAALAIPKSAWESYLSLHLASLPGWVGYIKWRATQPTHPWQQEYPIDPVKFLAVRLFYERELVAVACERHLGIAGRFSAIRTFMDDQAAAYRLRRGWVAGHLPTDDAHEVRRLIRRGSYGSPADWQTLSARLLARQDERRDIRRHLDHARALLALAQHLSVDPAAIETTSPADLHTLFDWLDGYPPSQHGPRWLDAFEAGFRREVLGKLSIGTSGPQAGVDTASRPLAQVVFCIDVRSEVFRRHLEHRGGYETLGLAGFFGVPLDYQPFSTGHHTAHCPVLLRPKNLVKEIPRSYHSGLADRHKLAAQLTHAAHRLLHDLKENVVTPYVMVEALGWFFGLPLLAKTLIPRWYHRLLWWLKDRFTPPLATTLTVDKIPRDEAEAMVVAEQHALIREIVQSRFGVPGKILSTGLLDKIRRTAVGPADGTSGEVPHVLELTHEQEQAFYEELRERYRISSRGIAERLDRLTHTGFSITEQVYFVEAALRLMGLTENFSRVVLFCAHGSTTENNPYESALDCGACGGNHGLPNARAIAVMANKPAVRDLLKTRGIAIPNDTHFVAGQHDTTTDRVQLVDLEDVPTTHRRDLQRLSADLDAAAGLARLERHGALTPLDGPVDVRTARRLAQRRSVHWGEVRQEWGLSRNGLMVIGRREMTQAVDLEGRAFLHSYDHRQDPTGRLLETIMTAPLVVAQWINMEHYFSTVDNEVYGSGSKVYHNVVGRIGVMTGARSDLRIGLPAQTVLRGRTAYHEPMRLLAVVEAPRARVDHIIARHPLLEQMFSLGWATLVVREPQDGEFYYYDYSLTGWKGGRHHDRLDAASDEGNPDRGPGRPLAICH